MTRFIFKRDFYDSISGEHLRTYETVYLDAPEIESKLTAGGSGESGYEHVELVGVEVLPGSNKKGGNLI